MISLRVYWTCIVASLIVFMVIVGILVIYDKIEHGIGVDLIINSGATLFSVVFLTSLLTWRENDQWKSVKDRVLGRLEREIYFLSLDIMVYFQGFPRAQREPLNSKSFFPLLKKAGEGTISLDNETHPNLRYAGRTCRKFREYLSDLEMKYFKFLETSTVHSIMKIQDYLNRVIHIANMGFEAPRSLQRPKMKRETIEVFQGILREIYKIYADIGIKSSYPEWYEPEAFIDDAPQANV